MINERISTYNKKADQLFSEWKSIQGIVCFDNGTISIDHKNNVFIRDGVVCPETWFSQKIRPLFLLKEAYGGTEDWDLIKDHLLVHKRIDKMWERISGWTKGILSTTDASLSPFINDDPDITSYGNEYLKKIAVINIKKSGGKSASEFDDISTYALFDKDRLKSQFEICDPTIIICGYTSSYLETILDKDFREPRNDNLYYHIELNGHDVLVIDYWHPANHYPDLMNHYSFLGIYQNSLTTSKD